MVAATLLLLFVGAPRHDEAALRRDMVERGIPPGRVVIAFAADPRIAALATKAAAGQQDSTGRAGAIYDAILALKRSGAIAGDRDNVPKARPPKTASEVLAVAQGTSDSNRQAGCYELSALYVAAARLVGLDAVGVERVDPSGTGQIGHIMAGVRLGGDRLTIFDLQNESRGSPSRVRELSDLELAAHHYNHLAVAAFLNNHHAEAERMIGWSLLLAPESASFLNNRATILAAQGELDLAIAEVIAAVHLQPSVPLFRYQLGRLRLSSGDLAGALEALEQALSLEPRYHLARRDRAWALLLAGRAAEAEADLERVEREDPKTPDAALYLGLLYTALDRPARAHEVVERGLQRAPGDGSLAALADLLAGKTTERAAEVARLRAVLASVPSGSKNDRR